MYGRDPRPPTLTDLAGDGVNVEAEELSKRLHYIHQTAKAMIAHAQATQKRYYDTKRKPMEFKVGEEVRVRTTNIRTR